LLAAIAGSETRAEQYAIPISNGTSVFVHNPRIVGEPPVFTAGSEDRLLILEKKDDKYKVTNRNHLVGWVDVSLVTLMKSSETLSFSGSEVNAYLDNPSPVYIIDADNVVGKTILINRSFAGELRENIDRMTMERMVAENGQREGLR
jgi:hypothetical protein